MERFKAGMLAKSKAGHDIGQIYIIVRSDDAYVYLADGSIRTLDKLKKKRQKHVQIICEQYDITTVDDTAIKRILKDCKRKQEKAGGSKNVKS